MNTNQIIAGSHPVWAAIQQINLDPIKIKLMGSEDGDALSREEVDRLSELYRRYLFLAVTNPEMAIVPTKGIDTFWHTHILDTAKYRDDCQKAFGFFLDHFPYFGMRGKDDRQNWERSLRETGDLYQAVFGDEYLNSAMGSLCQGGSDCGAACAKCCEKVKSPMHTQIRPTFAVLDAAMTH